MQLIIAEKPSVAQAIAKVTDVIEVLITASQKGEENYMQDSPHLIEIMPKQEPSKTE